MKTPGLVVTGFELFLLLLFFLQRLGPPGALQPRVGTPIPCKYAGLLPG